MRAVWLMFSLIFAAPSLSAQEVGYGLPRGAQVIETREIRSRTHPARTLVLWMLNPMRRPRETPDEPYACPEETRGSYYSGATRVSLVDTRAHRIINTVEIKPDDAEDSFDLPYSIHQGSYYFVGGVAARAEGRPTIMRLMDYNGDGRAFEFALFDAEACMGLATTLIGYSEAQDKVIQYPIRLTTIEGRTRTPRTARWVDYLFSKRPRSAGYWNYAIDYRGRGGSLNTYVIRYNRSAERFEGTVRSTVAQQD